MKKDTQMNYEDEHFPDYASYKDHELKLLFEQAETDSDAYLAIMEELSQRGYDFEPESSPFTPLPQLEKKRSMLHWWNLLGVIFGVAATLFYLRIHSNFYELQTSNLIMVWTLFALVISMLYIGNGIRMLIQLKDPRYLVPIVKKIDYWIFTGLWFAVSAYQLYSAIKALIFFTQNEVGFTFSLYGILPSLGMCAFALFLALAFLYLSLEINKQLKGDKNE